MAPPNDRHGDSAGVIMFVFSVRWSNKESNIKATVDIRLLLVH